MKDDYVRAAHVIHTFGQPAKVYNVTSIHLTSPERAAELADHA